MIMIESDISIRFDDFDNSIASLLNSFLASNDWRDNENELVDERKIENTISTQSRKEYISKNHDFIDLFSIYS
ncbi:hypothetical protein BLOT_014274 [Blomia tropicalis]|nr:hypothetical protein BLOT_014274 [Blomia tropicalis]